MLLDLNNERDIIATYYELWYFSASAVRWNTIPMMQIAFSDILIKQSFKPTHKYLWIYNVHMVAYWLIPELSYLWSHNILSQRHVHIGLRDKVIPEHSGIKLSQSWG